MKEGIRIIIDKKPLLREVKNKNELEHNIREKH